MDPLTAALIAGGINALQGKRGSDLLKSTVRDAAITYGIGAMTGGAASGGEEAGKFATQQAAIEAGKQTLPQAASQTALQKGMLQPELYQTAGREIVTKDPTMLGRVKSGLETFTDVFRSPTGPEGVREIDKFKVGIGAGTVGAGLYAAGAFDPKTPTPPSIPGANMIYYSQPEAFRTFGTEEIDPSKFPEKPYANMQDGGMAKSEYTLEDLKIRRTPENVIVMSEDGTLRKMPKETAEKLNLKIVTDSFDTEMLTGFETGGIAGLTTAREQMQEIEEMRRRLEALQEAYDQEISQRSTNEPSDAVEQTSKFNKGDLVDALPSKTNKDENNEKNYKRTSGKMVVDSAGKGSENKDTMLAQLADGEFVTKSSAVRGAGIAMGADPKNKQQQREMGAKYFYDQMAKLDQIASMGRR